jgi:hypothetical protein
VDLGRFRVCLRVDDVIRAAEFYRGMGFTDVGSVPGPTSQRRWSTCGMY